MCMAVGVNEDQTEVIVIWTRGQKVTHYKAVLPKGAHGFGENYERYYVSLDGERWKFMPSGKLDMEPRKILFEKVREIRQREDSDRFPPNINEPVLIVLHAKLEPVRPDAFKRKCPVCDEGVLLGARDNSTFKILPNDRCILCGQRVKYLDVEELNNA